jgi:hypothetical protein
VSDFLVQHTISVFCHPLSSSPLYCYSKEGLSTSHFWKRSCGLFLSSVPLLSAARYVGRPCSPGRKEADEDRTSVATSPNISPPIIGRSKVELSEDDPEIVSTPVTKEKEEVTNTKEGVSAPPPTSTLSKPVTPKETTDVRILSLPSSCADGSRTRKTLAHLPNHHPDQQRPQWKQQVIPQ